MVESDHALMTYCLTVVSLFDDWKDATATFHRDESYGIDEATLEAHLDRLDLIEHHVAVLSVPSRAATVQLLFLTALAAGQVYMHARFARFDAALVTQCMRDYQDELDRFLIGFEQLMRPIMAMIHDSHQLN